MKKISWLGAAAAVFIMLFAAAGCNKDKASQKPGTDVKPAAGSEAKAGDDPVWIKVNGKDIHRSEVEKEETQVKAEISRQMPTAQMDGMDDMIKLSAMQRAVEREILEQEADKENIKEDPAEVDEQITKIKGQYPSEDVFNQFLQQMGMTEDGFKQEIATYLRFNKLLDSKVTAPEPTDEEIQKVYDDNKHKLVEPEKASVQHLFLSLPPSATDDDRAKKKAQAADLVKQARGGADFADLVAKNSESAIKEDGGKHEFKKGEIPGDFDKVVFGMKPGEISDPIDTPMGFYVVKMLEIIPESTIPLEDVKQEIVQYLQDDKKKAGIEDYINKLKADAKIEYIEPLPKMPAMHGGMGMQPEAGEPSAGEGMEESMPPASDEAAPPPPSQPAPEAPPEAPAAPGGN